LNRERQRLAFGRVAELYDRARPTYPGAVVDRVIERAGLRAGARIVEVGAGAGKPRCCSPTAASASSRSSPVARWRGSPDSLPTSLAGDWHAEIAGSEAFSSPALSSHRWLQSYAAQQYSQLLETHQDHILLEHGERARLPAAVAATIDEAGGVLAMPFVTRLCVATRR
jgi:hypothetical protein